MKFVSIKIVLDTNVWLSGLFWEGEASKIINLAEKKTIIPILSEEILQEIADVLSRESKFQKFLIERKQNIEDVIRKIIAVSEIIEVKNKLEIIKEDSSDNMFIETAIEGNAKYIISYDKHLLELREFRDIKLVTPNEFSEIKERSN